MLAVSALVAPTMEEAHYLSTSQAVSWALFASGEERRLLRPEEASRRELTPAQQAIVDKQSKLWIVGDPTTVAAAIASEADAAGADEVMVTTTIWDHDLRLRSYELLAAAWGLEPVGPA
jgi:alkanesulfonate monooxygenase SsuD/methylene tetrahydromethanopterin reductase-like flavin-dependent oxidoreductase (luciferase family)